MAIEPTITVNGITLDVRRDDIASAIAKAYFRSAPPDAAARLDKAFVEMELRAAMPIVRPLRVETDPDARYFYQLLPNVESDKIVEIYLHRIKDNEPPQELNVSLSKPPLAFLEKFFRPQDSWPYGPRWLLSIEENLRQMVAPSRQKKSNPSYGIRRNNFEFPVDVYAPIMPRLKQDGFMFLEPSAFKSKRKEILTDSIDFKDLYILARGLTDDGSTLNVDDYLDLVHNALRTRLERREEQAFEDFFQALNPDTVRALKACGSFNALNYSWMQGQNPTDGRIMRINGHITIGRKTGNPPASAEHQRNRRQFAESMPFFMHMALNGKHTPGAMSESLVKLDAMIKEGKEILTILPGNKPGEGLILLADLMDQYFSHMIGLNKQILLKNPQALVSLAKIAPPRNGNERERFIRSYPFIFELPSERLPKNTAEWTLATILLGPWFPATKHEQERMSASWGATHCKIKAKIAKAFPGEPITMAHTIAAIENCNDYLSELLRSLVLPAAAAARGRAYPTQNLREWEGGCSLYHQVRDKLQTFFTYEQTLDGSLRYHTPHLLQQTQAALYSLDTPQNNLSRKWLPLTTDFIIPKGTIAEGRDLGGIEINWLTTLQMLRQEADENKNCVHTYENRCIEKGVHILKITAPHGGKNGEPLRSTAELRPIQEKSRALQPGQNMEFGNRSVEKDSLNAIALRWLAQKINDGQALRAKSSHHRNETPASVVAETGLPDFSAIDFAAAEARRSELKMHSANLPPSLAYPPDSSGAAQTMLDTYRRLGLLPPRLNRARTPEELLSLLGIDFDAEGKMRQISTTPTPSRAAPTAKRPNAKRPEARNRPQTPPPAEPR